MPHIVHVVESFGAGTLSMVSAMANRQAQAGYQATVIHSVREETPANWRDLFDARLQFIQLPMGRAINALADQISPEASARLKTELRLRRGPQDPWVQLVALECKALVPIMEQESTEVAAVVLPKLPVAKAAAPTKAPAKAKRKTVSAAGET